MAGSNNPYGIPPYTRPAPALKVVGEEEDDEDFGTPGHPDTRESIELPISSFNEWDRVGQVKNVLRSLRAGYFRDPAVLADQMLEDDRIAGDLQTRLNGLLGADLHMRPAREGHKKSEKIARAAEDVWDQMSSAAAQSDLLRWGLMLGIGVAENVWDTSGDQWLPRLKVWHPQFVYWNWSTRTYWVMTQDRSIIELPNTSRNVHSDGKWIVYTPYGYYHGWLRCMLRALATPWLIRQWTYRDWARYSEVHGLPIKKAIVPAEYNKREKGLFVQSIANAGNESVIACPQAQDGDKFDIELVEAKADTYQGFEKLLEMVERSMAITLLGQDMSQRAQGGSLAQAKDNIRDDYRRFDAQTLNQCLREQQLHWWTVHNHGDERLCPILERDVEPKENEKEEGEALFNLARALPALSAARADVKEILDHFGIPILDDDEEPAMQAPQPQPGAAPGVMQPPAEAEAPPVTQRLKQDTARPAYGKRRAKQYHDRLAAKAKARAAKVLEVDLAEVRSAIKLARDWDDLHERLSQLEPNPERLAKVIQRARVLAQLDGRHDVLRKL